MNNMFLLDIFFPRRCLGCGRIGRYFCNNCLKSIKMIGINEEICPVCEKQSIDGRTHPRCRGKYTIDGLTGFFRYDGIVRKAVKTIKYRLVSDLIEEFAGLVPKTSYNLLRENIPIHNSVIIPVPLHNKRFRERGFNQAELLAQQIGLRINIPVRPDILSRVRYTAPQVSMKKRKDRLKNMDDVFAVNKLSIVISQSSIILVDDVFTTGATMRSAANVLKRAGAGFVWGVTMAR
jgi:ComF family protein